MNTQKVTIKTERQPNVRYWLAGIIVLITFALADVIAVALPSMALSPAQIFAGGAAYVLIAGGSLYTVWQLKG